MLRKICLCTTQTDSYKLGTKFPKSRHGPETINIERNANTDLGFTIVGGVNDDCLPLVQLSSQTENSRLHTGDVILSINGVNVTGCSAADAQSLLTSCGNFVQLEILSSACGHGRTVEVAAHQKHHLWNFSFARSHTSTTTSSISKYESVFSTTSTSTLCNVCLKGS
jgi:hypothetical protein